MEQQTLTYKRKTGEIRVTKINECEYEAMSESGDDTRYRIVFALGRWFCGCKGFAHTCRACKHIAAMKKLYRPSPPPVPESKRRKKRRKKRRIGMPAIKCRHCRSTKFKESHVRPNKLYDVQVYRCLSKKCGRYFTPDDGFLGRTYREDYIVPALEDRASCKKPHDILDSLAKNGHRPARSTLHTWFVQYPTMCTPYLASLDYNMSETVYTDEIVRQIGGVKSVIFTMEDGGTRSSTAYQIGRFKGSHNVQAMFRMDATVRGTVPSLLKSDGASNFASAFEHEWRYNCEGKPAVHIRHIHMAGDTNTNLKERDNGTLADFVASCRGLKTPDTAYIGLYQIHFNAVRSHTGIGGLRPMEAAGVYFEHPNKWLAVIRNSADYNNAVRLGVLSPVGAISPRQSGFQAM